MSSDSAIVRSFRGFILQDICQHLGPGDINSIVYMQDLPPAVYSGKSALEVLKTLEMLDRYSAHNMAPLTQMMKAISRNDLAKKVEKYAKSQKKHTSKKDRSSAENRARTLTNYIIEANLKGTTRQAQTLSEWLEELKSSVCEGGFRRIEEIVAQAEDANGQLQRKLKQISSLLTANEQSLTRKDSVESTDSSGSLTSDEGFKEPPTAAPPATIIKRSGSTQSKTLPRDTHKQQSLERPPIPIPVPVSTTDEEIYSEVCERPSIKLPLSPAVSNRTSSVYYSSVTTEKGSDSGKRQMVTGQDRPKIKPPTAPKPKPRSLDSDFTGGSGDTSTGDSGFVDAKRYLKTELLKTKPMVKPRRYTPLQIGNRDTADYYTTARTPDGDVSLDEDMYESMTHGGCQYMNIPKAICD